MAALDVREGTVRWRRGPGYFRALIIADGLLYMAAYGELRCYDVSTGVWLWDADLPDENVTRLAIDQGRLYALSRETWILDSLTGNLETTFNTPDPSVIVMIAEGKIFTATRDKVLAYDAGTTQLLWSVPYQFENPHWYPLIVGGTLYFRTSDGSLVATNVETVFLIN